MPGSVLLVGQAGGMVGVGLGAGVGCTVGCGFGVPPPPEPPPPELPPREPPPRDPPPRDPPGSVGAEVGAGDALGVALGVALGEGWGAGVDRGVAEGDDVLPGAAVGAPNEHEASPPRTTIASTTNAARGDLTGTVFHGDPPEHRRSAVGAVTESGPRCPGRDIRGTMSGPAVMLAA